MNCVTYGHRQPEKLGHMQIQEVGHWTFLFYYSSDILIRNVFVRLYLNKTVHFILMADLA
uniref:Uncharacterized protein n=1 Tax=Arion vulgaris TaxID=1028688 RepID=A0A0B7B581_9EUPU